MGGRLSHPRDLSDEGDQVKADYLEYLHRIIWCLTGMDAFNPWSSSKKRQGLIAKLTGQSTPLGTIHLSDVEIRDLAQALLDAKDGWSDDPEVRERVEALPESDATSRRWNARHDIRHWKPRAGRD